MFYRRTDSITFNGFNSYLSFGVPIKSKRINLPEQVIIEQEVPYMNGCYDFSYMSGKPIYKKRQINVVFNLIGANEADLYDKYTQIVRWLTSTRNGTLTFDSIRGWQFENVTARISTDGFTQLSRNVAELSVNFIADPYKSNGKQNITIIPSCPRFTGNTFGYIYKSGGSLKITTTDNICENVQQTTNSGSEKIITDITFTANTPIELVFALYTPPKAWRSVFAIDASGNSVGDIPSECEDTSGNTVYRWTAEKYSAAGVRFVANVTEYRGVKVLNAGEIMTARPEPIRCKYNGDDIRFILNGGNMTYEANLAEGGNIIAQPHSSAEVYAALRKEAL